MIIKRAKPLALFFVFFALGLTFFFYQNFSYSELPDSLYSFEVYRPSNGTWYRMKDGFQTRWGSPGDIPLFGDFDGDATVEKVVYRPSTGEWWFQKDGARKKWGGVAGDIPLVGDFKGTGKTQIAIWRPANGTWYFESDGSTIAWGQKGDIPLVGDFSGAGVSELAVYRPTTGEWWFQKSGKMKRWGGVAGDIPVVGNFSGEGKSELAIYRPTDGKWYLERSGEQIPWGGDKTDIPMVGDFHKIGRDTVAVYRVSESKFYVQGIANPIPWGAAGDIPLWVANPNPLPCTACLKIRVGRPWIVMGDADNIKAQFMWDAPFLATKLPSGKFRAFTGNSSSYAFEADLPWSLAKNARTILTPVPNSNASCGRWITGITRTDVNTLIGYWHAERECHYDQNGQTHMSTNIGVSFDNGLTWTDKGTFLEGYDGPTPSRMSGEGGCTSVTVGSKITQYCLRALDWSTIVVRADRSSNLFDPNSWKKFAKNEWNTPSLGGKADTQGYFGVAGGYFQDLEQYALVGEGADIGGAQISLSRDGLRFQRHKLPLYIRDGQWLEGSPFELTAYFSLMDPQSGDNVTKASGFLLTATYLEPGQDFKKRFLYQRDVFIQKMPEPLTSPQTGVALSRWQRIPEGTAMNTTGPVMGNGSSMKHAYDGIYLLTVASWEGSPATTKLVECKSNWGDKQDLIVTDEKCDEGYSFLRTAGYVYKTPQPDTVAIYRCVDPKFTRHFVSTLSNCEGKKTEWLLGYALK